MNARSSEGLIEVGGDDGEDEYIWGGSCGVAGAVV